MKFHYPNAIKIRHTLIKKWREEYPLAYREYHRQLYDETKASFWVALNEDTKLEEIPHTYIKGK